MEQYTIIEQHEDEIFYLNHSCLSSLSFGSEDMAWTTTDHEKAELMLNKVEANKEGNFEIIVY